MGKKRADIPIYNQGLIETHCHLDYLKGQALEDTLDKALAHNINKIITIAVEPDNLKAVRDLCSNHEMIYGTQGVHPHEAKLVDDVAIKEIKDGLSDPKIVAVGEIGLDYHYNHSPRDVQIDIFKKQLQIAIDYDMPVVIHTREADEDTKDILKEYAPKLNKKGVIHSFTSSIELAKFCLDQGFHLGFNGIITFPKAQNVRDVLEIAPLEQVLIETDSPFLTPVPYRGKENAPFYLPFVAQKVAEIKSCDVEKVIETTTLNAQNLFGI